jgi:hypothetical protein
MGPATKDRTFVLGNAISAFVVPGDRDKPGTFGGMYELPEGAELEICGMGFNERTVTARWGDRYYVIYSRDLASAISRTEIRSTFDLVIAKKALDYWLD